MDMNLTELAAKLALFFVPFLFALCFHEFAHGWVAKLKGDRTAEMMGRLTLNPFAHMDLVGTILLPRQPGKSRHLGHRKGGSARGGPDDRDPATGAPRERACGK